MHTRLTGGITAMSASDIIDGLHARDMLALVNEICKLRGVTVHDLCGRTRSRGVSHARQEVWWRIRHHPEYHYSYLEIARLFARDHTTIMAGISAHARRTPAVHPDR
jgi:chromosomal replication initiation ATPase DnaA